MENNEEIKYVPSAKIVYNASPYGMEDTPAVASAQDVTMMSRSIERLREEVKDLKLSIELVKSHLMENHEELGEHAQDIADMLDIELIREVNVTVTVEFQVELALKPNESIDDIIDNLEFTVDRCDELTEYYQSDVTWKED